MNALVPVEQNNPKELIRQSTDVAGVCKEIVVKTACNIQGRKYVKVEGWQAIATAHGCVLGAKDVARVEGGVRATGELRRIQDGALLASAEGFVGDDEATWAKRAEYAKRAMAQTRAMSRVARSAFAHVVVMMDAGLETTPAEEIPAEDDGRPNSKETVKEETDYQVKVTGVRWSDGKTRSGKTYTMIIAETTIGDLSTFNADLGTTLEKAKAFGGDVIIVAKPNPPYMAELLEIKPFGIGKAV